MASQDLRTRSQEHSSQVQKKYSMIADKALLRTGHKTRPRNFTEMAPFWGNRDEMDVSTQHILVLLKEIFGREGFWRWRFGHPIVIALKSVKGLAYLHEFVKRCSRRTHSISRCCVHSKWPKPALAWRPLRLPREFLGFACSNCSFKRLISSHNSFTS